MYIETPMHRNNHFNSNQLKYIIIFILLFSLNLIFVLLNFFNFNFFY
jgi:hypothetical protein